MTRSLVVLGSTGSVGVSTLDVVRRHPDRYRVAGLSAWKNVDDMRAQCHEFRPEAVAMADAAAAARLEEKLAADGLDIRVAGGEQGIDELAGSGADTVVVGIVGAAGLLPTLAAVRTGGKVLIANKEPLVMLGHRIMAEAEIHDATIIPLDSEHNAIFQCLPVERLEGEAGETISPPSGGIRRILLTGSGGPFRVTPLEDFDRITPAQACAHPNWDMGPKISVDSATMMNKGLELIEACVLFQVAESDVEIVVHPQSVIHSMVEYVDGSILAQMGSPDMRVPIAHALGWPDRIESGARRLDLVECANLSFEAPDLQRFPAIDLAREAARTGGTAPAVLSAANEIAVQAFLAGQLSFDRIPRVAEEALNRIEVDYRADLETVLEWDARARQAAREFVDPSGGKAVDAAAIITG